MLIPRYSHILRSENPPEEIWCINYKQIQVRDERWSRKKIHEFFKSIDPTKIEFDKHKTLAKELIMLKPIRAKFIFEVRMHQFSEKSSRTAPPYSFHLVGIEVPSLEEAEQGGVE